jgi:hypothetical protein
MIDEAPQIIPSHSFPLIRLPKNRSLKDLSPPASSGPMWPEHHVHGGAIQQPYPADSPMAIQNMEEKINQTEIRIETFLRRKEVDLRAHRLAIQFVE